VWWAAQRPHALAWSPELGWSVAAELGRRLGAPLLRLLCSWFAVGILLAMSSSPSKSPRLVS